MRLCGVVLLMIAVSGFSIMHAMDMKQKPRELHAMTDAMSLLYNDITARSLTLPDALAHVGGMSSGCARSFFTSVSYKLERSKQLFQSVWEEETAQLGIFGKEEREIVRQLGMHLGQFDAASQGRAIDTCINGLRLAEKRALADAQQYSRLYTGLGLTLGAMLAIILS